MKAKFTSDDMLQSKVVTPAWYQVLITKVTDKPSKDLQSVNSWFEGKILHNAENGDKTYAGVPTPYLWLFNSKGAFNAIGLLQACGVDVKTDTEYELTALQGRKVEMFIGNTLYNGAMVNSVTHQYRAARETA